MALTLPNPLLMITHMLSDGAFVKNTKHDHSNTSSGFQMDMLGGMKMQNPKETFAFLGGEGKYLADAHADHKMAPGGGEHAGHGATATAGGAAAGAAHSHGDGHDHGATATTTSTTGGGATAQSYQLPGQAGVRYIRQQPGQYVGQSPVQNPMQSPMQSPIQMAPMKQVAVVQTEEGPKLKPIKKGLQNPIAIPVGIADGIVDFLTHCVGAHVEFLWKDPGKLLKDPLGAIKINELEINPMGHIFKSIDEANQRDNPMQQIAQLPMGLESIPALSKFAPKGVLEH